MSRRRIELKTPGQIEAMRASGLVTAAALAALEAAVVPGAKAKYLDDLARDIIRQHGAEPSFLGYRGFPASICVSINEVVVHGIPEGQVIHEGDLVSVDCGAVLDGWHSDAAFTVVAGEGSAVAECLNQVARQALWDGLAAFAKAKHLGQVGAAIEQSVKASEPTFSVVEEYTGHGIGTAMHMEPEVPNVARRSRSPRVSPGLVVAIEPMVVAQAIATSLDSDGWTVRTVDGGLAAHWEHTVARTAAGIWVLTAPDGGASEMQARGVNVGP
ncbi:MAG: type I methionyl aminopeptidase [Micrococcales bacterium]|nr:type I methionyl aminopeptidase [Micrococcales bacterium]